MRNLDLYGIQKVNSELHQRALVVDRITSLGEKTARIMAWQCFIQDQIQLDDSNERTANLARIKHGEAIAAFWETGDQMDIDSNTFVSHFFDELGVINKKVTKKGVQIVFYIFVALGLFGLYKIFF
ncbi:hypothetical protein H8F21_20920 [Pseudomonas sp. P66]|uniref:Uncharacterized protein n=1 Tax=Pseudomonas arcuscaelestis TaxID=2710591 RepID=A0ABS2C2E5_9PSED|nr:hypothetical protein [Pseudomonas putida]MBA6110870.1 hypothetical protein [Pseudomonas asiatica]MBM5460032.1 hypothetical protein [Pseudomonas arcuscaelestis]EKT4455633.1 hypothetical protein [Pseudomonas putida]EKT4512955.1 hypothetical protein [Pseudomonas putida]EKT4566432.1 hypothetical protein [Pseudomonas putida]